MSKAHYALVIKRGLTDTPNEAPIRQVGKSFGIRTRGLILPFTIENGKAVINVLDKTNALAEVPRDADGRVDYAAMEASFPQVKDPSAIKKLAGVMTVGEAPAVHAPKAAKPKAAKSSEAAALPAGGDMATLLAAMLKADPDLMAKVTSQLIAK